jgi:hypothetical protein
LKRACLGEYLDRKEIECREVRENSIIRSFITYTLRQAQLEWSSEGGEIDKTCSTDGESMNVYRILMGKTEGNRSLRRPMAKLDG